MAVPPATDAEVIATLQTYDAKFSKAKTPATNAVVRLNLLAGLMWLHAHSNDMAAAWPRASPAQHIILADALRLNLAKAEPPFLYYLPPRLWPVF